MPTKQTNKQTQTTQVPNLTKNQQSDSTNQSHAMQRINTINQTIKEIINRQTTTHRQNTKSNLKAIVTNTKLNKNHKQQNKPSLNKQQIFISNKSNTSKHKPSIKRKIKQKPNNIINQANNQQQIQKNNISNKQTHPKTQ